MPLSGNHRHSIPRLHQWLQPNLSGNSYFEERIGRRDPYARAGSKGTR